MPWALPATLLRPGLSADEVLSRLPSLAEAPEVEVPATVPPPVRETLLDALAWEGANDPLVRALAARIVGEGSGLARCVRADGRATVGNPREAFQDLLTALPDLVVYTPDPDSREIFSRVRATLAPAPGTPRSRLTGAPKGRDDCEGMATLYAALARSLGLDARPVWIDQEHQGAPLNHVAAVACGLGDHAPSGAVLGSARFAPAGCAWVEATIPGARVGESPPEAVARHGRPRIDIAAEGVAMPASRPAGLVSPWSGLQPPAPCKDLSRVGFAGFGSIATYQPWPVGDWPPRPCPREIEVKDLRVVPAGEATGPVERAESEGLSTGAKVALGAVAAGALVAAGWWFTKRTKRRGTR